MGTTGLKRAARLYLLHVALSTASLAIVGLFFNLTILALGFTLDFLGLLTSVSLLASAVLAAPLLGLLAYLPLRLALIASALLQLSGVALLVFQPDRPGLLLAAVLLGAGAVLFELSAAPFMMRHSDAATRDRLFSLNTAIRIGLAGVGSLLAGQLPRLAVAWLGVAPGSAAAYHAALGVALAGLALSIIPLLRMPAAARMSREPDLDRHNVESRHTAPGTIWRELVRRPRPLLALLISPALISIGAALLIPYLNLFFQQRFAVSDQLLGGIFAGLGICTGLATLAAPRLARRFGRMPTIVITEALAIPLLVLLGIAPLLGVAVGAAWARAALFNMGAPLYEAFALERYDAAARPTISALLSGAYSVGYLFAPLASAYVLARYGFGPIFAATTLCYLLGVAAKYLFWLRGSNSARSAS